MLKQQRSLPQQYMSARIDLLLMVILSFVNIILFIADADIMFMFSASLPTFAAIQGLGMDFQAGTQIFFVASMLVSAVWVGAFLLCFFLSKKRLGFMIAANILFIIDCFFCIPNFMMYLELESPYSGFLEVVFHALVLYYLIVGWRTGLKLKAKYGTLTPDPAQIQAEQFGQPGQANAPANATYDPNRPAQPYGQAPQSPYGQPYGQTPQSPYGQPYGQTPQSPYGQPYGQTPQSPYGQPYGQSQFAQPEPSQTDQTLQSGTDASGQSGQDGPSQS